jgi:hypothetical protein
MYRLRQQSSLSMARKMDTRTEKWSCAVPWLQFLIYSLTVLPATRFTDNALLGSNMNKIEGGQQAFLRNGWFYVWWQSTALEGYYYLGSQLLSWIAHSTLCYRHRFPTEILLHPPKGARQPVSTWKFIVHTNLLYFSALTEVYVTNWLWLLSYLLLTNGTT